MHHILFTSNGDSLGEYTQDLKYNLMEHDSIIEGLYMFCALSLKFTK